MRNKSFGKQINWHSRRHASLSSAIYSGYVTDVGTEFYERGVQCTWRAAAWHASLDR